ncbi:RrF2 family transcriptional regulator [Clostridium beijerinckii]|uniref:Rrf2 family transcriptional regulator n=1 Tax=Clostridium beijerinckii TaxID=1520 RepID=A0A7X9SSP4_CLOBE|nr:Rrf2 family transcriptional regulator [Clostridium beijerinckii]NMF07335.1 Rrf2 family transcriptional regulator [Clostridium beijerinckii]
MNINQESDYAFRIILMLSKEGLDNKLDAKSLSEKGNIPLRFLLKLTRKLTQAGILKSYRGVNGGYAITREPKDITLKDVVEAIQGPIIVTRCVYDGKACSANKADHCSIHKALYNIQNTMINELEKVNFDKLKNDPW